MHTSKAVSCGDDGRKGRCDDVGLMRDAQTKL